MRRLIEFKAMEKPKSLQEFVALIKSMKHRERFVFRCGELAEVEVYTTFLYEQSRRMDVDVNVLIQYNTEDGDALNKRNKLLRLWNESDFVKLYNQLI